VKTIVLLVHEEDTVAALEEFSPGDDSCIFIAISPHAGYPLQKRSVRFRTPHDYTGGDERFAQGLENFERIKKTTLLLDSLLASTHAGIPSLRPAQYPVYFLKNLFDVFSTTTHLLKTIIHMENPKKIVAYQTKYDRENAVPFPFRAEANIFALVLQLPGWEIPVEIKTRELISPKKSPENTYPRLGWRSCVDIIISKTKGNDLIFNMGLIGKRFGLLPVLSALSDSILQPDRYPILIYESGYNWDDASPELYRNGFAPIVRLTDTDIEHNLVPANSKNLYSEILDICERNEEFRKNAEWCGIDTSPILLPHLAMIVAYSFARSPVTYNIVKQMIREKDIRILLLSIHTAANTYAAVQAAHDSGIPVVSWQHGGGGYNYHPIMPFAEFAGTDYHLVYGTGVAESYRNTVNKIGLMGVGKFIPVGSSSFDRINNRNRIPSSTQKNQILYITTSYYMNFYYISFPANPLEYDLQLWSVQQKIMDLAKNNPEINLTIKLHPGHIDRKPLNEYKTDNKVSNINLIVSESTVSEMVETANFVILDLVSTSILQVLRFNKPIFVFTGNSPPDPGPTHLLKKRAYTYERVEDFIDAITRYIRKDRFPLTDEELQVDLNNTEFLQSYGTYLNDGKSADRAVIFLKQILKNEY